MQGDVGMAHSGTHLVVMYVPVTVFALRTRKFPFGERNKQRGANGASMPTLP